MWFQKLTGFKEKSPENVRKNIRIERDKMISLANSREFSYGKLEIPTLEELRKSGSKLEEYNDSIQVEEIVANVLKLHTQKENENALFQVASQFNLLEMVNPDVTPEDGITGYEYDKTQGPTCAIACGAGTIYRNYFVEVNNQIGQTDNNQIDCLELVGKELDNENLNLWDMENGYMLPYQEGLISINKIISKMTDSEREHLKGKLKTGIQWNTEVTVSDTGHCVSQIYCSALPVAYCDIDPEYWEPFARLILEALYEATFYAGMLNMKNNQSNVIYLTAVGGGAFGNEREWILDAMDKAVRKFKNVPLNIKIVSYRWPSEYLQEYIEEWRKH